VAKLVAAELEENALEVLIDFSLLDFFVFCFLSDFFPIPLQNWLLDGFPRTVPQAEILDQHLVKHHQNINAVISLNVPPSVIIDRIKGFALTLIVYAKGVF